METIPEIKKASTIDVLVFVFIISNFSPVNFNIKVAIKDVVIENTTLLPIELRYEYFTCRKGRINNPINNSRFAILKKSKILIIDEATANVDYK